MQRAINFEMLGPKYDADSDHYKQCELDVPWIAIYDNDNDNGFLLAEKFESYIWRHASSNHIHFSCKTLNISIM